MNESIIRFLVNIECINVDAVHDWEDDGGDGTYIYIYGSVS